MELLQRLLILALYLSQSVHASYGVTRNVQEAKNKNKNKKTSTPKTQSTNKNKRTTSSLIYSINPCFCNSCNNNSMAVMAGDHSCGSRISWLKSDRGLSELQACQIVAQDEHPAECGSCNPLTCQLQPICAVPTCTVDVLSTMACNDSLGGCHTCADRIRHLVETNRLATVDACEKVAFEQFPAECGKCSGRLSSKPVSPTARPVTPSARPVVPTASPITLAVSPIAPSTAPLAPSDSPITLSATPVAPTSIPVAPTSIPVAPTSNPVAPTSAPAAAQPTSSPFTIIRDIENIDNVCGVATCTRAVLDSMACSDNLGGCFTCESRINYLINTLTYKSSDACKAIGFDQFLGVCGGCMPDELRSPGESLWHCRKDVPRTH